jgi:hypothetical protein
MLTWPDKQPLPLPVIGAALIAISSPGRGALPRRVMAADFAYAVTRLTATQEGNPRFGVNEDDRGTRCARYSLFRRHSSPPSIPRVGG